MSSLTESILGRPDFNYIAVLTVLGLFLLYLLPKNFILGKKLEEEKEKKVEAVTLLKNSKEDFEEAISDSLDSNLLLSKELEEEVEARERVLSAVDELEDSLKEFKVYCQIDGGNKDSSLEPTFIDDVAEIDETIVKNRGELSTVKIMDESGYIEKIEMESK